MFNSKNNEFTIKEDGVGEDLNSSLWLKATYGKVILWVKITLNFMYLLRYLNYY